MNFGVLIPIRNGQQEFPHDSNVSSFTDDVTVVLIAPFPNCHLLPFSNDVLI